MPAKAAPPPAPEETPERSPAQRRADTATDERTRVAKKRTKKVGAFALLWVGPHP